MNPEISERAFEEAIEAVLLRPVGEELPGGEALAGEATPSFGGQGMQPGGYHQRLPQDYDRTLCLLPRDVVDFLLATQPKQWQRLSEHYKGCPNTTGSRCRSGFSSGYRRRSPDAAPSTCCGPG